MNLKLVSKFNVMYINYSLCSPCGVFVMLYIILVIYNALNILSIYYKYCLIVNKMSHF